MPTKNNSTALNISAATATVGCEAQLLQMADALLGSMDAADYERAQGADLYSPISRWCHRARNAHGRSWRLGDECPSKEKR